MIIISSIRKYVFGIIIGLAIGLWFGVNIGEGRPIYSNPFDTAAIKKKVKESTDEVVKDSKKVLREQLKD
jgi:hypothetical protein